MSNVEIEWKPEGVPCGGICIKDIPMGTVFTGHFLNQAPDGLYQKTDEGVSHFMTGYHWSDKSGLSAQNYRPVNIRIIVDAEKPE